MAARPTSFSLDGRCAIITGAAQGIGRAIAEVFSGQGAELILIDRDAENLASLLDELDTTASCHMLDLSEPVEPDEELLDDLARADIFVANAGAMAATPLAEASRALFTDTMSTHVFSHVDLLRPVLAGMSERRFGRVILMSSIAAERSRVPTPAYSAAKGAVSALTRSIAQEFGASGIVCNAIAPGLIRTAMSQAAHTDPDIEEAMRKRTAVGRWGEPQDVAPLALFLASDEASFVSGQVITVDGGASTNV